MKTKNYLPLCMVLAGVCASLIGCANPVQEYYTPSDIVGATDPRGCITPQIVTTNHLHADLKKYMQQGYAEIGYSAWSGEASDIQKELLVKAKQIDACLILISKIQTGSEIDEMPVDFGYSPYPFYGGGYGYGDYTSYAPYTVLLYKFDILFLSQMEKFSTGLYVTELDDKSRSTIGSNKGVQVTLVVNGSTAYNADIIPGDIITKIGTYNLTNYDSYQQAVESYQGESAVFVINRMGKVITKTVNVL